MDSERTLATLADEMAFIYAFGLLAALRAWMGQWRSVPEFLGRRHAKRFLIRLRTVAFDLRYCQALPADCQLLRRWQKLLGDVPLRHTQQVGTLPSFLGVAGHDAQLVRSFTQELICGAELWSSLRRQHLLFEVAEDYVRVYAGLHARPHPRLAAHAASRLLPRALARREEADDVAALPKDNGHRLGGVWAEGTRDGYSLRITGRINSAEAKRLVQEILARAAWKSQECGNTEVRISSSGAEVQCELAAPEAAWKLARFVEGFLGYVVLGDLHLGVCGRDTFGPAKAMALVRLLETVAARRSTLVLNGDFLELLHERYANIRASYPAVFEQLKRVRRLVYVIGNHDEDVLTSETIRHDLGRSVEVVRYAWEAARGLYFEHGHFAMPGCHATPLGRLVSRAAGLLKRVGLNQIEHWCEDKIGGKLQDLYPWAEISNRRMLIERHVAVAAALRRFCQETTNVNLFCSHTHEPARTEANPVHYFVRQITGATYTTTGAWTSRRRLRRNGQHRVEWTEIDARNQIRICRLDLRHSPVKSLAHRSETKERSSLSALKHVSLS